MRPWGVVHLRTLVPVDTVPSSSRREEHGLSERDQQILDFERRWWRYPGSKEQAVRDTFGLTATRYYQVLNALIDRPAALAHDPILVRRLRRRRSGRQRIRSSGRMTGEVGR